MASSQIGILFCLLVLGSYTEGRPMDNTNDSIVNRAAETFFNIYDPIANQTKNFVGYVSNGISNDDTINSILNRTTETFYNIYDPIANHTKDIAGNISNSINNDTVSEGIVDEVPVINFSLACCQ